METTRTGDARPEPQVTHCYIYAHVARSNPLAIERQVQDGHTLAKSLSSPATEYKVTRVFRDDGGSGLSSDRPAYKELLAELEKGDVATVLVSGEDRLYRSTTLQQAYSELSSRLGITTYSAQSGRVGR
ncbi:recombinase family protein [Streptomyces sp. NPDC050428]|uniref:recombinase family protein n=1 Tax=Streptomyces sp. NPDC050428 TaxID=3155757 RepID=UPI00341983CF